MQRGETLGLVGESGCGKSTVARNVVSLETPTDGEILFRDRSLGSLSKDERKRYRRQVQMVFQNPSSSFDPRMTIGESIAEPMLTHGLTDSERLTKRIETLLSLVGLSEGKREQYPHELSDGEKQRAALARALSLDPELLVLDEPVSALDVSVQAEILALIERLQEAFDLSILLISHDMSVVHQLCDRVVVMYVGEAVEHGRTSDLFEDPKHPYTKALLDTVPRPDPHDRNEMVELTGDVPDPSSPPSGCRFHTRCPKIIPPEDYSLAQPTWTGIFALRIALRDGEFGLESTRERLADERGDGSIPEAALREAVRREYGIPTTVDHERVEGTVSSVIARDRRGRGRRRGNPRRGVSHGVRDRASGSANGRRSSRRVPSVRRGGGGGWGYIRRHERGVVRRRRAKRGPVAGRFKRVCQSLVPSRNQLL